MPRFVTEKSPQSLSTPFHHAISEVHYRWQGMALSASEKRYADGSPALLEQWHYRGDFDLLAKEARAANDERSDFYPIVSGPDGTPQEMYSANGRPVLAAGEATVVNGTFGTDIAPHSGHYHFGNSGAQNAASETAARSAFEQYGIIFP